MTDYDDLVRRANEYVNEWPGIPEAGPLVKALVEQLKLESTVRLQCATDSQNHLDRALAAERERDALRQELGYIANAKRFDRTMFDDDTSFADWAQSRCRAALLAGKRDAAMREGKVE